MRAPVTVSKEALNQIKLIMSKTTIRTLISQWIPNMKCNILFDNRFNEDCSFTCCNYREHQTHFHCMRKDCNYRFCDKTRFVQHTARHERLDTLCGSEFEGFRGVTCARDSCEFNIHNLKGKKVTFRMFVPFHLTISSFYLSIYLFNFYLFISLSFHSRILSLSLSLSFSLSLSLISISFSLFHFSLSLFCFSPFC